MIPMNEEAAIKCSIELAKALCESCGEKIYPDADGANMLADFIETLQARLTSREEKPE